jgi:type III secretion protein U
VSQQDDSGDKTEQPTHKKLQDARKKGQVPKSKDATSTVELLVWFALSLLAVAWATAELKGLMAQMLQLLHEPFANAAPALVGASVRTLIALTAALLLPVAAIGLLTEYLQAGPVWSLEKVTPKLEHMNPVEGVKKMFTMDALVELLKSIAKTVALGMIGWLAIKALLPQLALLPLSTRPELLGNALWETARPVMVWTVVLFALLALLDGVYQRFSFTKRMRMSMRDIRQEQKDSEGDPHTKQHRKQLADEWSQRGATQAASQANVLVVNPTHVAIAIDYDRETCPVPTIAAKGEDHVARAMREAAEAAGVPVVRNVPLARDLLARGEVGELIPQDLFDVIAEVVLWAREVREELAMQDAPPGQHNQPPPTDHPPQPAEHPHRAQAQAHAPDAANNNTGQPSTEAMARRKRAAPGEDLTRYTKTA